MANIYDVARRARVSAATVSAVVNDSAYVSPRLKGRVDRAIDALGYQPNLLARSLATQQSYTLGLIVPDIANPFWPEVVRGAEDRASAAGYTLLLSNSDDDPVKEARYLDGLIAKRVDGIIIAKAPGKLAPALMKQLKARGVALTQLLRVNDLLRCDAVLLDDEEAAYEGVAHLVRLGYTRIAIVTGPPTLSTAVAREKGYEAALAGGGLAADPTLRYQGDFGLRSGYEAGLQLLRRRPDAIFVSNSLMAVGFVKAMRQYQRRCPQDVAIVTCDDHAWMESFSPQLTTVNFPRYELGAEGARILIERIAHPDAPARRVRLKSPLVIRESCGYQLRAVSHA
jgi:LacI family transcriptional regulator